MLIISGCIAFYEQASAKPNLYIVSAAFVVFMFALMKISSTLNKNNTDNDV